MTEERLNRIKEVALNRQNDLTVVLNNVHDPHNIGAVLRTCDSVGIKEIYALFTDDRIGEENLILGKNSASSARKWVDVYMYRDSQKCFADLKKKYDLIFGTHLGTESVSLYSLNLSKSVALVFGNEHSGIDEDVLQYLDGNFVIPQYGMVKSLNISVSVAITLYETLRQREINGSYNKKGKEMIDETTAALIEDYVDRHKNKYKGKNMKKR